MKKLWIKTAALRVAALWSWSAVHAQALTPTLPEMPIRGGEVVVKAPKFESAWSQVLAAASAQGARLLDARFFSVPCRPSVRFTAKMSRPPIMHPSMKRSPSAFTACSSTKRG